MKLASVCCAKQKISNDSPCALISRSYFTSSSSLGRESLFEKGAQGWPEKNDREPPRDESQHLQRKSGIAIADTLVTSKIRRLKTSILTFSPGDCSLSVWR